MLSTMWERNSLQDATSCGGREGCPQRGGRGERTNEFRSHGKTGIRRVYSPHNGSRVLQRGIQVVERFVHQQIQDVDEVLFNSLLDACCRAKDTVRLEAVLSKMRSHGIQPSSVTLGILVKAYGQVGDINAVWREWLQLRGNLATHANAVTFGCVLDACVK